MPALAPAIGELGALVALLVALGLVFIAYLLVKALFGVANKVVGWVPWVGKKVQAPLHTIEKRLVNGLSAAVTGLEEGVAATWHVLAHTIAWMGHEIAAGAAATWRVWWYVSVKYPLHVIHAATKHLTHDVTIVQKITRTVYVKAQGVARALEHPLGGQLGAAVKAGTRTLTGQVRALERWVENTGHAIYHAVAVTLPGQLGHLRGEVGILTREWGNLRSWVRKHERLLGSAAMTAAVAYALRRLGATWIRCGNWRRLGKQVCGMDASLLDSLLLDTLAIVGTISIVELAEDLLNVEDEIVAGVKAGFRELRTF